MIPQDILSFLTQGVLDWPVWKVVIAALVFTHITIAAVTIYLHRCQAHRALDLHAIPAHFFRFWLWLTTGMQTREWASIHRKHHAKCETAEDPHSPQILGINKVMWQGSELYMAEALNVETLDKYGRGTPEDWIEKNVYSKFGWHGVGLMLVVDWTLFGLGVGTTVWAVQMLWIPIFAAGVINGVGHFAGYRNFDCADASRNIVPWGILIGGEELHNNHHTYATSAKLSSKWYEFDIGWAYIRILAFLRLATIKKIAPTPKFEMPRPHVDLDNLHAVIAHRYDVMAKYAKSFKKAYREEIAVIKSRATDGADAVELAQVRTARRWLHKDVAKLSDANRDKVQGALLHSPKLAIVHQMRVELAAIWERSSASSEQLLVQLQDWCKRAEASGIRTLHDFSMRLRSYA